MDREELITLKVRDRDRVRTLIWTKAALRSLAAAARR